MASICQACGKASFPVTKLSPCCRSRTSLGKVKTRGVLLEHSISYLGNTISKFGVVEMSGIRLIGGFEPDAELTPGMKVKMVKCGLGKDGMPFYDFSPLTNQ